MAPPTKATPELRAKAAKMKLDGSSLREIEEVTGVSRARWSQIFGEPAPAPAPAASSPQKLVLKQAGKAPTAAAAPEADRRRQILAIVDGLLADEALVASLPLDAAELLRRLVEPPAVVDAADLDPLAMLARAARGLELDLARLAVDQVAARRSVWQALTAVARIMEGIRLGRPADDGPDEATARLVAVRDAAIMRMGIITGEAAEKLVEDRLAYATWAGQELAPRVALEAVARLDAMLGGPTT